MKRKVILLGFAALMMCGTATMTAQVGINTETPKTTLDIVQKDKTTPGQGFRLDDGNEYANYVLTTAADGSATWKPAAITMVEAVKTLGQTNISLTSDSTWKVCNMTITLPPGNWKVDYCSKLKRATGDANITNADSFWLFTSLCDDASMPKPTSDIPVVYQYISWSLTANPYLEALGMRGDQNVDGTPSGFWIVNNTSTDPKTYHVVVECSTQSAKHPDSYVTFSPNDRENKMVATPILP